MAPSHTRNYLHEQFSLTHHLYYQWKQPQERIRSIQTSAEKSFTVQNSYENKRLEISEKKIK